MAWAHTLAPMMILAGDIGGTKTNLAAFVREGGRLRPLNQRKYDSRAAASFEEMLESFLGEMGAGAKFEAACFGAAGAVIGGRVRLTNLAWAVDAGSVGKLLGTSRVRLLNDMEATWAGVDAVEPSELYALQPAAAPPHANQALIAAGTGVGESFRIWTGGRYLPVATEGGHADFAPRTDQEIELLRYLKRSHTWVDVERVVSGRGFFEIHRFLGPGVDHPDFHDPGDDPAAEITRRALDRACSICVAAVDLWISLYGAEAGNLALRTLARGGVFVAGGIAAKILPKLREGRFTEAFAQKAEFGDLLGRIPITVVLNQEAPLLGAAATAAALL
ncbi:MAG TPA: glucokinase [Candidatus Acidoferrales bacterium]|nr:glucokinase [Candidatus Acidoferrales bacterium]